MRIAVSSDLHIEFDREISARSKARGRKLKKSQTRRNLEAAGHPSLGPNYGELVVVGSNGEITCKADLLVLAGDIDLGIRSAEYAGELAEWLGVPVVLIAGNHEFYGGEYHSTYDTLRNSCESNPGLNFLEQKRIDISIDGDRVRILGCTLWTDFLVFGEKRRAESMGLAEQRMSDFSGMIRYGAREYFVPDQAAGIFAESVSWLRSELATGFDGSTIVVTHHAPSARSIRQEHKRDLTSAAYASTLDDLIEDAAPALWIHGHMHHSLDYRIGKTRVVCNPRGYRPFELNKKFQPGLLLEVQRLSQSAS